MSSERRHGQNRRRERISGLGRCVAVRRPVREALAYWASMRARKPAENVGRRRSGGGRGTGIQRSPRWGRSLKQIQPAATRSARIRSEVQLHWLLDSEPPDFMRLNPRSRRAAVPAYRSPMSRGASIWPVGVASRGAYGTDRSSSSRPHAPSESRAPRTNPG
jgi:hypothetical protein